MEAFSVLPDPQTNGGLLIAVAPGAVKEVHAILKDFGLTDFMEPIGLMRISGDKTIHVEQ